MSAPAPTSIRLLSPGEAAVAAPFMLGYWPEGSACAVFVDDRQRVILVMRWDQDAEVAPASLAAAAAGAPAAVHLVVYPAAGSVSPAAAARWQQAALALQSASIPVQQVLLVTREDSGDIWVATRGDERIESMAAAAVAACGARWGCGPWRATRADHVGDIAPDHQSRERVERALADRPAIEEADRANAVARVRRRLDRDPLDARAIADVLVGLGDIRVRDTVLWDLMHDAEGTWPRTADRLAAVVAASPDSRVAPPATVLAILRWQVGDGTRAAAAAERALAADPAYTLAALVQQCLASGMHPLTWRRGLADLTREECLQVA